MRIKRGEIREGNVKEERVDREVMMGKKGRGSKSGE